VGAKSASRSKQAGLKPALQGNRSTRQEATAHRGDRAPRQAKLKAIEEPQVQRMSAPATTLDPIQFPEERRKKVKTRLSARQLREFRDLLLQKRAELAGDVRGLTSEALHRNDNGAGDRGTMPIHMADLGTDNWEQDFTLGLIANEEALVRDIDEALDRIQNRTYGICLATARPISLARLRAKPWAKYCIEYARLREEGRAP
jgi:RNA polymerase-binding protein DksA